MKKQFFRVGFDLNVTEGTERFKEFLRLMGKTESEIDEALEKIDVIFKETISKIIHDEWGSSYQKVENFNCEYIEVDK